MIKRELDEQLGEHGITTSQWAVLKLLDDADHVSQTYIAERLNADRATCGAVIEKLIKSRCGNIWLLPGEDHSEFRGGSR